MRFRCTRADTPLSSPYLVENGAVMQDANGLVKAPDNSGDWYLVDNGKVEETTKLVAYEGQVFYVQDGKLDADKTDFINVNDGSFLVINGRVASEANGLVADPDSRDWYFVSQGQVQNTTDLVSYDGEWFYVQNGKLDTAKADFVGYDGSLFLVAAGRIVREANGLVMDPDGDAWYYCAAGQVQTQYTGLTEYDGAWFYVVNGKLDTGFNGIVTYDGAQFRVVGGQMVEQVF